MGSMHLPLRILLITPALLGPALIHANDEVKASHDLVELHPGEERRNPPPDSSCPDWEKDFAQRKVGMEHYRSAIEEALRTANRGTLPTCNEAQRRKINSNNATAREGQIEVSNIAGLSEFKYDVIAPRNPPEPGEPIKTLVVFAGGPGNVFSRELGKFQSDDYQVLVADYAGMGKNALKTLTPGKDDQNLNLDDFANLMEKVIRKEIDSGQMKDYVLQGHSFGSVGATVVGSHLSNLPDTDKRYRPKGILIGGVAGFLNSPRPPHSSRGPAQLPLEWVPRIINNHVCILPQGHQCFDDKILEEILKPKKKKRISARLAKLYKSFSQEDPSPLQSFVRDALHWEASTNPRRAAEFLEKYFHPFDPGGLYCWYKTNFNDIVFLHREENASMMASVAALNCHLNEGRDPRCGCFKKNKPYTSLNYQIGPGTKLHYVNGDADGQTPLGGAKAHFDLQATTNKAFLEVCGGGHSLYSPPEEKGRVSFTKLLDVTFTSTAEEFSRIRACP